MHSEVCYCRTKGRFVDPGHFVLPVPEFQSNEAPNVMPHSEVIRVIEALRWELECVDRAIASLQRFGEVRKGATPSVKRQGTRAAKTRRSPAGAALLTKLIANQRAAESPAAP